MREGRESERFENRKVDVTVVAFEIKCFLVISLWVVGADHDK